LHALFLDGLTEREPAEQASLMRQARFDDAQTLLDMVGTEQADGDDLFALAAFAFRGGHYDRAADLYQQWYTLLDARHEADMLNRAAWQLYLARAALDTAVDMAREAHSVDPSPDITDTLARLLYVTGDTDEAIALEEDAAVRTEPARAEEYQDVVRKMKAGEDLADRPAFESFPGPREDDL
jgi:tetratricopeptide (TPR) repeat protein